MSCFTTLCLILLGQGLLLSWKLVWQPTSPSNLPALASVVLGLHMCAQANLAFYVGARDLNQVPNACTVSAFISCTIFPALQFVAFFFKVQQQAFVIGMGYWKRKT